MKEEILFGTYTKKSSQGIYQATLDTELQTLSKPKHVVSIENPTYLTTTPAKTLLTIAKEGSLGGISAYALQDEAYTLLDDALEDGPNPCYVAFDAPRQLVYTANYHLGTVAVYRLNADQTLTLCDKVTQTGNGPRPEQASAHVHYTDLTPDGRLAVVDLGSDTVTLYDVSEDGKLTQHSIFETEAGFGPRHLAFAPDKKTAYLVGELSSQLAVLDYDQTSGTFKLRQTIATIPTDWTKHNGAAAIKLSKDGRFIYVSNRGHDSLAVFEAQADKVTLIQLISSEGHFPRDFALDLTEKYLVLANQETDNAVLYSRDLETGMLTCLKNDIPLPEGVCVYFVA